MCEVLHSNYVGRSTTYTLHSTKPWDKRIKSIIGIAGIKSGQVLLAVWLKYVTLSYTEFLRIL